MNVFSAFRYTSTYILGMLGVRMLTRHGIVDSVKVRI